MKHARKAMKKRDIHLEASHSECKLLKEILKEHLASYIYICTLKVLLNMLICSPNKGRFAPYISGCRGRIKLILMFSPKIKRLLSFNSFHIL